MGTTTNIVWLQNSQDDPIPSDLRPYVALFTSEDACYQFLSSLPGTLRGLTLVLTDLNVSIDRLVQLKPISTIYLLSPSTSKSSLKTSSKIHGLFPDRQTLINQIFSDLNRTKSNPPGFLTGVMAPFQGFHFILTHPSTWSRALVPACIFTIILFSLAVPGVWGMQKLADRLLQDHKSRWKHIGIWLLRILFSLVAIFFSLILAFITSQPLSAPALESLVREQERELKYPNRPEEGFCASICRSIRVAIVTIILSIFVFLTLTVTEFFIPPAIIITTPLKVLATGFILAYDLIDYPLSLHFFGVRERTPWFRQHCAAALGFGLAMEVIFLIPGAFLLLLPAGVCGATRLVVTAERAQIDQPLLLVDETL